MQLAMYFCCFHNFFPEAIETLGANSIILITKGKLKIKVVKYFDGKYGLISASQKEASQ